MNDNKKVLLVVRWPIGGIRTFIRYVFRQFDPEQWCISIIAPDIAEMRVLIDDLAALDVCYLPVEERPSPISFAYAVTKELMRGRYDLVHSQGFTSGMCAALAARMSRTSHLMTSHDVINKKQFSGISGKLKKYLMGRLLGLIDTIHSVSHDAEKNLLSYFPILASREGRCIVIHNGIEVDRFKNGVPRDLQKELGMGGSVFLIGFFGRFMSQKGFRYLVDAVELLSQDDTLPKRPIVLAFGFGGFVREEMQSIQNRGLENHFKFMPFEPNVAGAILGLDVVAIPSLWEACPILPMEVLACGIPIIASDCIGLREVARETPAKVISKADVAGLAQALEKEIKMSSKESFVTFRTEALSRFDVKKTYCAIENIYTRMA